jgi:hypothetical protein
LFCAGVCFAAQDFFFVGIQFLRSYEHNEGVR